MALEVMCVYVCVCGNASVSASCSLVKVNNRPAQGKKSPLANTNPI